MISDFFYLFCGVWIPQPNRAVPAATDKPIPIWIERYARYLIRAGGSDFVQELFGINIPQADSFVPTPTGDQTSIRTKRYAPDNIGMPFKGNGVRG